MKFLPFSVLIAAILLVISASAAVPPSVTTQMYDNAHTGWNPNETQLNIANSPSLRLLFTDTTDASTYAQPLYMPSLSLGSLGTRNVVFVATENNSLYAFDADSAGSPLWTKNLTPSGEALQTSNDYNNTRIPSMGISGTPVIDAGSNTLYVVAASKTTSKPTVFHQRLHAIDITNGQERPNSPVDITAKYPGSSGIQDGSGNVVFEPLIEFDRAALTLLGSNVFVAWSAHEDNGFSSNQSSIVGDGIYQGWITAYDKTSLAQAAAYNDSPNLPAGVGGGSIWQGTMGLVADDASIYALTANGPFDANSDYGDSALRLTPALNVADSFTPCNQQELNDLDVDLASGGMLILPNQSSNPAKLITFAGKEGSIYLVDRTAMGGYTPTSVADNVPCTDKVVQKLWRVLGTAATNGNSNRDAYWGAPAFFSDASGRQYVYYTGDYSPIKEFDLANGALTAGIVSGGKPNQTPSSTYNFPHGGTIPVISSNGGDPASAVLWAIRHPLPPSISGTLALEAYSATDLTRQLVVDLPAGMWTYNNDAFLIPTVVNGKVYVSSAGQLDVFGLGPSASATPTSSATITPTATITGVPSSTPTPVVVQITAPSNGATVSGPVTVSVSKAANVSWANVYIDGTYFASTPPSSFSWNSTKVVNGVHTISANGYSSGSTLLGSSAVNVYVQNNSTPTPTSAPTRTPTATPAPTSIATLTPAPTPTGTIASTPVPTPTAIATMTGTPTLTPSPSSTAVFIVAPINNATVSGSIPISVSKGTAVSWVDIYVDGGFFGSTPPSSFIWNSTSVTNGQHTISATGFSSAGTAVSSASIVVTVQNSAVQIIAPTQGATVSGNAVAITVAKNANISWVNVYIDGNYFASTPPTTFNWNSTTVANGPHTISATGYSSGSAVLGSASISVTVAN